jgi:molybdopterin adenylyltransferase
MLSRQEAAVRGASLIMNLPSEPRAIGETLDGAFPAVPYCFDLIGGPHIETHPGRVEAFRPKSASYPPLKEKNTSA